MANKYDKYMVTIPFHHGKEGPLFATGGDILGGFDR